jgi:energy-coupling factor transport system ATP-binding protein
MITAKNITVRFNCPSGKITALDNLSLEVGRGEYTAVLGINGSGKSTFLRALCGLIPLDSGEIMIGGTRVVPGSFGVDFFGKVGVVFQEPESQFVMRDVRTEISAVLENLGLDYDRQLERLDRLVDRFGLRHLLEIKPEKLSGGQMQLVNLACAASNDPLLLLLDEPSTFLDQAWRLRLLELLDQLNQSGTTIIHITQYSDEAARARRVCLLDRGQFSFDGSPNDLFDNEELIQAHKISAPYRHLFKKYLGVEAGDYSGHRDFAENIQFEKKAEHNDEIPRRPIIEVSGLHFKYATGGFEVAVDALELYPRQIVGLVGPTGSGKSTLAFLISGLLTPKQGQVNISSHDTAETSSRSPDKIGISWQLADLAIIGPTVEDDIRFGPDTGRFIDVKAILARVDLDGFEHRIVDTLSGGEKRRLSIGSALAPGPRYLILDEPSAFLDAASQANLIKIIRLLADGGRGILIIGHDLFFISELADRILGMKNGAVINDLPAAEFFSNSIYLEKLGIPINPGISFRQALAERGFKFPNGTLDPHKLAKIFKIARG